MLKMNYSDVRQNLASVIDTVDKNEPVTVLRKGQAVAVIISIDEFNRYKEKMLDDEFESIMSTHGEQIKALADR